MSSVSLLEILGLGLLLSAGFRYLFELAFVKKLIGLILIGNAINLLLLISGRNFPAYNTPPILTDSEKFEFISDPLPQALVLTSIVIGFGTLICLAFFYLSSQKTENRTDLPGSRGHE